MRCGEQLEGLARTLDVKTLDQVSYRVLSHECLRHNDLSSCDAGNHLKPALDDDDKQIDESVRSVAKCLARMIE